MKYAVKIVETLERTVIVDAGSYRDAEDKVTDAYYDCKIELNADNSCVSMDMEDDTKNYIDIFGEEEFYTMEVTKELLE